MTGPRLLLLDTNRATISALDTPRKFARILRMFCAEKANANDAIALSAFTFINVVSSLI